MTPLPNSISERLQNRAPEVIQIRIGEKVSKGSTTYPRALDYFAFWRMNQGREICRDNALAKVFEPTGKPTSLPIRLVFDDLEANIRTMLACYDSSRRFCYNDKGGDIALRRNGGGAFHETPCDVYTCPIYRNASDATKAAAQEDLKAAKLSPKLTCKVHGIFRFALKTPDGGDVTYPGEIATFRTTSERMTGDIQNAVKTAIRLAEGLYAILSRTDKGLADTIFVSDIIAQMPYRMQLTAGRTPYGTKQFVSIVPEFDSQRIADIILQRAKSMTLTLGGFRELKALLPAQEAVEDSDEYAAEVTAEFYPDVAAEIVSDTPSEPQDGESAPDDYNDAEFTESAPDEPENDSDAFEDDNVLNPVEGGGERKRGGGLSKQPLAGFEPRKGENAMQRVYNYACTNWLKFCDEMAVITNDPPPVNYTTAAQAASWLKDHRECAVTFDEKFLQEGENNE